LSPRDKRLPLFTKYQKIKKLVYLVPIFGNIAFNNNIERDPLSKKAGFTFIGLKSKKATSGGCVGYGQF